MSKMNPRMREAFARIKPCGDLVMTQPSSDSVAQFVARLNETKKEVLQELLDYLIYPITSHMETSDLWHNHEKQRHVTDAVKEVLIRVKISHFNMYLKLKIILVKMIYDKDKPGMISAIPEELKLSVLQCLTALMLSLDKVTRIKMAEDQIHLTAQAIFLTVHISKLEKLRSLRIAGINCLNALTSTHPQLTDSTGHITDPLLDIAVANMLASILPGVLSALHDVATCKNNPGHAIVVGALNSMHRIMCITMHNKLYNKKENVGAEDFLKLLSDKVAKEAEKDAQNETQDPRLAKILKTRSYYSITLLIRSGSDAVNKDATNRDRGKGSKSKNGRGKNDNSADSSEYNFFLATGKSRKEIPRTPEWYAMYEKKISFLMGQLSILTTHEHYKVRRELAVFCYRLISECSATLASSLTIALDILISLSNDPYKEVSGYCKKVVKSYFASLPIEKKHESVDSLCVNFFTTLDYLPRALNNESDKKLSMLNLLYGYLELLCDEGRPQRLTGALSTNDAFDRLCDSLLAAADMQTDLTLLTRHATRDLTSAPSTDTPWCRLRHLERKEAEKRFQDICQILGGAECAELFLDRLLELFHERRSCELVYIINWVGSAPNSNTNLAKRIISAYIEEDVWYLPLEVGSAESPITKEETLDTSVYNPRAWTKDSVPGLYEGTVETRYTGISYSQPRVLYVEPNTCRSIGEAQQNMAFSCLVTEGLGAMAKRLKQEYQPYLLKTLCLILERVGSKYENLHLTGLKAINDVAFAFGHSNVTYLIAQNADYFTSQITSRLRKPWNTQSALQMLSVVMEYSDSSILDHLYGIVENVLVQCCDKYYQRHLYAYLQVFLTFITCIKKWFHTNPNKTDTKKNTSDIDVMKDVIEFANNKEEANRLLDEEELKEESAEEMYKEDFQRKLAEEFLGHDDAVKDEPKPVPHHIKITITILKRCINFMSAAREESLLAQHVLMLGMPLLAVYEDELLPLVHLSWAPLVARFEAHDPVMKKRAFDYFVVLATVSKDFLTSRAAKDILSPIFKFIKKAAASSRLKDIGSSYRMGHGFHLQTAMMANLPRLVIDLDLEDDKLGEAMSSMELYLSSKQPKPLQILAVKFFNDMLNHKYGIAWQHLRKLCANDLVLEPPQTSFVTLQPVTGSPYQASDPDYDENVKLIFSMYQ